MKSLPVEKEIYIADSAVVIGEVEIGGDSNIWHHVTIRADREPIRIGTGVNVQDNSVLHVDRGYPIDIGDYVTIGHGAIIHGCKIGNNTLIGMGAILQNGSAIGQNCIIGAGAVVTQNLQVPDNTVMIGCPARAVRKVTEEERAANRKNAEEYIIEGRNALGRKPEGKTGES